MFLISNTALATDDLKPTFNISEAASHKLKQKQIPYKWRIHRLAPSFNTHLNKHPLFPDQVPVHFTRKFVKPDLQITEKMHSSLQMVCMMP